MPDLPGCIAAAETEEDVRRLIHDAIEFHLEDLKVSGEPTPEPVFSVEFIEVAA